jgi:hypothetical protein
MGAVTGKPRPCVHTCIRDKGRCKLLDIRNGQDRIRLARARARARVRGLGSPSLGM